MSDEKVEFLEEKLEKIEQTVEDIAHFLFKGNGHSMSSKIAILENTMKEVHGDVETIRVGMHDLRSRVLVNENKIAQLDKSGDRDDGKMWHLITIALSLLATFLLQLYFKNH